MNGKRQKKGITARFRKGVLTGMLGVLLVPAVACRWFGDDNDRITLHGNIEMTEVGIAFKTPGRILEITVHEGDNVARGQVLAILDVEQLLLQREREAAGLKAAGAALEQTLTAIRFQQETIEGETELRAAEVKAAEAMLEQLLAGSRMQEIQQAEAAVASASTREEQARRDWERARELYENDDISTAQFDMFRSTAEAAAADLLRARENRDLVREGPRKEQIANARAQVERALAALRLAGAGRIDLDRRRQEVAAREADIERALAQVALLDRQIAEGTLTSPIDGVVMVRTSEPGEVIAAGTAVLALADIDRPWVRGYVAQQDLGRVRLGQEVDVTTDSFPGRTYKGTVTFISSEAEFTPKTIQTTEERVKLVYRIKVAVENPKRELKLNMPADAFVQLADR
jgi:HlyD family secretion protein